MIGSRRVDGFEALTLSAEDGEIEVAFVPEAGMVGCSLQHRGEELLGQRGGLARYVAERSTMGIPLLHPWANRVARTTFRGGRTGGRPLGTPRAVHPRPQGPADPRPARGRRRLEVERHEDTPDGPRLVAGFDFAAHEDLMTVFPFPHQLRIEAEISDRR